MAGSNQLSNTSEPLSPRAQGKQPQHTSPLPNESFVLLQDSVIRTIPSQSQSSPNKKLSPSVPKAVVSRNKPVKAHSSPSTPPNTQPEPDPPNPTPISHHLRSTLRLFNLLSTRADIDHPLCAECTQILLSSLQRQLDETKKERDGYIAFEKEARKEKERDGQGMSREEAEKKIEKLKVDEKVAVEHLKEAEREREKLDEEMKALEEEERALEEEEAEWVPTTPNFLCTHFFLQVLASSQRAAAGFRTASVSASYSTRSLCSRLSYARKAGTNKCIQRRVLHRPRRCFRYNQRTSTGQSPRCSRVFICLTAGVSVHANSFRALGRVG